jgi:bis(5'-nucleosyl)-tetraphosphatase (symmetrical)
MAHAGIPPQWSVEQAQVFAREVETVIGQNDVVAEQAEISYRDFFSAMYGNRPALWDDSLNGMDRLRAIVNYLTRMRLLEPSGAMEFAHKGPIENMPDGLIPWFAEPSHQPLTHKVLFGHWASLNGETGASDYIALDTGCVWGRQLTAYCLDNGQKFAQPALHSS